MLTPQDLYAATDGGLAIVLHYYPQAEAAQRNHKFSIRDEKTPSCTLSEYNGLWWVKDFGSGGKAMDPLDVVMKEERCDFPTAMRTVAERYQIADPESGKAPKSQYLYERREATDDEKDGLLAHETMDFTMADLKTIFAKNVWAYLSRYGLSKDERGTDENAYKQAAALCTRYHLHSLAWYEWVSTDKESGKRTVHRYGSTEAYPILMFDEGQWQKFYKPKERDKSRRFFSAGQKPKEYCFGYQQCRNRLEEMKPKPTDDPEEESEGGKKKKMEIPEKLPEIILCTGGSDALNVAALGYSVVWLNSETADVPSWRFSQWKGLAERVYYLPDLDETGLREAQNLALEYLDLHTIYLPEELKTKRDLRGNFCKDIRDYFAHYRPDDFKALVAMAYPLKFWDEEPKRGTDGQIKRKYGRVLWDYRPNNELLYHFLHRMGFGLLEMPGEKRGELMVQREFNVVRPVEFQHVNRYVKDFLRARQSNLDLINAFHRSPNFSENSLVNLPAVKVSFEDTGRDFQYLFFQNQTWRVTATGIETFEPHQCDRYTWEDEVVRHPVEKLPDLFTITQDDTGQLDIQLHNKECLFFRFLINASRVHWRKELEEELDKHPAKFRADYLSYYQWAVDGNLLSDDQIAEQKQHLINKLCSFGYLLHRYKDPAAAFMVWAHDSNIDGGEEAQGGTGKSMAYLALTKLMRSVLLEGRNDKLTQNPHVLENVTPHTDLVFIDDGHKYFDFNFFLSKITSFTGVNPKGTQGFSIEFDESPKYCTTSNFPPLHTDRTTQRRLWFTCFSDYYHRNPTGEFRESREPKDEFGKSLFTDFTQAEWNLFLNLMAQSVKAWLRWGKVEPPMGRVMLNIYRSNMGPTFHAWADAYFSAETNRLDRLVPRVMAYETYKKEYQGNLSAQGWLEKLIAYCRYNNFTLNPVELRNPNGRNNHHLNAYEFRQGQWVKKEKKESVECVYVQSSPERTPSKTAWDDENAPEPIPF